MSFVVEDGTGLSNANSYTSLDYADDYFALRGNPTDWLNADETDKKAALVYATQWVDATYKWWSYLYKETQALGFPRNNFYDSEGRLIAAGTVPDKLKQAVCEMALEHLKESLNYREGENIVSESIGSASVTYSGNTNSKSYSYVKTLLSELGSGSKGSVVNRWRA